jgi:hypothetical protein
MYLRYLIGIVFLAFIAGIGTGTNSYSVVPSEYLQCTRAVNFYERKYNLPKNLLHSVATVESGRWNHEHRRLLPWPWTLNVEGRPYYFDNKKEAVKFLKGILAQGIEQVDVGCMQVNWHYHGKKHFKKAENAFNPVLNVEYAAQLLAQNHEKVGNWKRAVAIYHSKTADKGNNYAAKVQKILFDDSVGSKVGFDKKRANRAPISVVKNNPRFFVNNSRIRDSIIVHAKNKINASVILP